MEVEYLKSLKQAKNLTVKEWSDLSNVPESTINNILSRKTENPSFDIVATLILSAGGSVDKMLGIEKDKTKETDVAEFLPTVTDLYEKRLADKDTIIKQHEKEKKLLRYELIAVVLFVFVLFAIDIMHGGVGWFRYQ